MSVTTCVCAATIVCADFFSSTIGLPPLYNCMLLWAFFDNMCAAEYVCRVHFNQWSASLLFMSPCEPLALKTKREYDNQDFLCASFIPFWPFDDPLRLIFTSQLNSWTDIPSAGEGGGGPAEGSDPLQGRRDDVRGSQVRQGHRHLLDHLQGRVGHHPQRGVHAGVQGGAQSHCHSTHSSF